MNKTVLPLVIAGLMVLSGCSHSYMMKMTNGSKIVTASKPKLKNGVYIYKDAKGGEHTVSQGRISEIEPLSMANEDQKSKKKK
jgi:hypothetical protein